MYIRYNTSIHLDDEHQNIWDNQINLIDCFQSKLALINTRLLPQMTKFFTKKSDKKSHIMFTKRNYINERNN